MYKPLLNTLQSNPKQGWVVPQTILSDPDLADTCRPFQFQQDCPPSLLLDITLMLLLVVPASA